MHSICPYCGVIHTNPDQHIWTAIRCIAYAQHRVHAYAAMLLSKESVLLQSILSHILVNQLGVERSIEVFEWKISTEWMTLIRATNGQVLEALLCECAVPFDDCHPDVEWQIFRVVGNV